MPSQYTACHFACRENDCDDAVVAIVAIVVVVEF